MVQRKKNTQSGRKAGSIIDQPTDASSAQKSKAKKGKKQSRGK